MQWNELRSHIRHLPDRDLRRVEEAFTLAKTVHEGQTRKSGKPYFEHPVAVAHMLVDMGADTDTIIASLLHDAVEDTPLTLAEIEQQFGSTVATLIDGVTKLDVRVMSSNPHLSEQVESLRKMFTLMQEDVRIIVIKLVDRLHNMQTVEFLPQEKQMLLAQETLDTYVKIADKLCMQDIRDELESLCMTVLEPEVHRKLADLRAQNEQRGVALFEEIREKLAIHNRHLLSHTTMFLEHKTWDQLRTQFELGSAAVTGLSYFSVAFVMEDIAGCYSVLGELHQLWKREILSFQDFINSPQLNGYRGVHTTIILDDGTRVRCKMRDRSMHEYARKGVAAVCFSGKSDITEILPWTKRLSPLTADTEGRSQDFWQSLQNDILGNAITIHGAGNVTVQLPQGATVLDGAFYLLQEQALNTSAITMNGVHVSFGSPLTNAAVLQVTRNTHESVDREWLKWVKTGYATAIVRTSLSKQSEDKRLVIGRDMLQEVMTQRRRGFLSEFDEETLSEKLQRAGLTSLKQTYLSIADGRLEPREAYEVLFEKIAPRKPGRANVYVIRYLTMMGSVDIMDRLNLVHRKYGSTLLGIRYRRIADGKTLVTLHVKTGPEGLNAFEADLIHAGAKEVESMIRTTREKFLIAIVIGLWGLNPVFATWFLQQGMNPLTLMTIRFLTIAIFMSCFFGAWKLFAKAKLAPVKNVTLFAWKPAIANAAMMVYLYALEFISPSVHLMVLRFNTLLIPILNKTGKARVKPLLWFALALGLTLLGLLLILGKHAAFGLSLSCLTLFFYTVYSLSGERILHRNHIDVRYPYYLFSSGLVSGIIGLALLPFVSFASLLSPLALLATIYVLLCVCISQVCYSALLKTTRFKHFTDLFLAEVPIAILGEIALLGLVESYWVYGLFALAIGTLVALRWKVID